MSFHDAYAALLALQAQRATAPPIEHPCARCGVIQPTRTKYCGDCRPNYEAPHERAWRRYR